MYDDAQLELINAALDKAALDDMEVGMPFLDDDMFVCAECGEIFLNDVGLPPGDSPICANCLKAIYTDLAQQDSQNPLTPPV